MKNLFGEDDIPSGGPKINKKAFKAHALLCKIHGIAKGRICGDCKFFWRKSYSTDYFKCEKIDPKLSGNPATDHRKRWQACGLFAEDDLNTDDDRRRRQMEINNRRSKNQKLIKKS